MDCTYSNPVNYQGNTPASSIEAFGFSNLKCSTPSAQTTSTTTSGEINFSQRLNEGISDVVFGVSLFLIIIGLALWINIGANIIKR